MFTFSETSFFAVISNLDKHFFIKAAQNYLYLMVQYPSIQINKKKSLTNFQETFNSHASELKIYLQSQKNAT